MLNLVAMQHAMQQITTTTNFRCLKPHRPYTVDFPICARERVKARRQLPDESFAILADDLRRLVALAFPTAPHDVRMELAQDQFVDAVSSVRLQQCLKEDPPESLDAAVRRAVQLEAVWGTAAATPVPQCSARSGCVRRL